MTNLRLFIAVPIPGPIKAELAAASKIITDANPHVRAVSLQGIHLTLKFLGDTPEQKIPDIRRAMEAVAAEIEQPIRLSCAGVGAFPKPDQPRVLWAGLEGDTKPLIQLARRLDRKLSGVGFSPEKRVFHPHLTLGRIKAPKMLGALRKAMDSLAERPYGDFTAEALVLYRSELKPTGAVYTSIERVPLPTD